MLAGRIDNNGNTTVNNEGLHFSKVADAVWDSAGQLVATTWSRRTWERQPRNKKRVKKASRLGESQSVGDSFGGHSLV